MELIKIHKKHRKLYKIEQDKLEKRLDTMKFIINLCRLDRKTNRAKN